MKCLVGDLNSFRLEEEYDLICSSGSLTYISLVNRPEAFRNYREQTTFGGINAFNVFVENPSIQKPPTGVKTSASSSPVK